MFKDHPLKPLKDALEKLKIYSQKADDGKGTTVEELLKFGQTTKLNIIWELNELKKKDIALKMPHIEILAVVDMIIKGGYSDSREEMLEALMIRLKVFW